MVYGVKSKEKEYSESFVACVFCKEMIAYKEIARHQKVCKDNPEKKLKKRREPLNYEKIALFF